MELTLEIQALLKATEPTCFALLECQRLLQTRDRKTHRLIGQALDRWGISKEELAVRNRLCRIDLMSVDL